MEDRRQKIVDRWRIEDRRQKIEDGRWKMKIEEINEDRRQNIKDRRSKIEDRTQKIDRRQKIEDGRKIQMIEDRRQKTEGRRRKKIEDRRQNRNIEDKRQKIEDRRQKIPPPLPEISLSANGWSHSYIYILYICAYLSV